VNAETIILVSVVGAAGLQLAAQQREAPSVPAALRVVVGGFLLAAVLLLLVNFWPEGARGLAVVILVTSVVLNGQKAFQLFASLVD